MVPTTVKADRVSELRMRLGFPADASRWMLLMLILALPPMLFWRRKLGSRMVSLFRLLMMSALMLLWGAAATAIVAMGDWDLQVALFAVVCQAEFGIAMLGTCHRIVRWVMYQKGEKLSTLSPGISQLSRVIPNANAERYLDPLLTVAAGIVMCLPMVPLQLHAPGSWLVLSGLALYAIENYMHGIQLDQQDGLLRAEGHELATARFYGHSGEPAPAAASGGATVATGLDADLQASIARRQQRRLDAADATAALPASSPAPAIATEARQTTGQDEPATVRDAVQRMFDANPTAAAAQPLDISALLAERRTAAEDARRERNRRLKHGATFGFVVFVASLVHSTYKSSPAAVMSAVSPPVPAASAPDAAVLHESADRYYAGVGGVDQDKAFAATIYLTAASLGYAPSQVTLGYMYEMGEGGLKQDAGMAVKLYRKAAEQGNAQAQTYLADMYMIGSGVKMDKKAAVALYQKAEAQGEVAARYALGKLYLTGEGELQIDNRKGQELIAAAGKLGFEPARKFMAEWPK